METNHHGGGVPHASLPPLGIQMTESKEICATFFVLPSLTKILFFLIFRAVVLHHALCGASLFCAGNALRHRRRLSKRGRRTCVFSSAHACAICSRPQHQSASTQEEVGLRCTRKQFGTEYQNCDHRHPKCRALCIARTMQHIKL